MLVIFGKLDKMNNTTIKMRKARDRKATSLEQSNAMWATSSFAHLMEADIGNAHAIVKDQRLCSTNALPSNRHVATTK